MGPAQSTFLTKTYCTSHWLRSAVSLRSSWVRNPNQNSFHVSNTTHDWLAEWPLCFLLLLLGLALPLTMLAFFLLDGSFSRQHNQLAS